MAKKKKAGALDLDQYAKDYGFQLAFLKSDPELYSLFKRAIAEKWDTNGNKFALELQKTKWYRTHGSTYRQNLALKTQDPATYNQSLQSKMREIADKAGAMGVAFNSGQLKNLATHYLDFGWNDSQLNDVMSKYITYSNARGQAASNITAMQQSAWKNGLRYSGDTYRKWAQQIASGNYTVEDFTKHVRQQAMSIAPGFADQLKAGMDLYDVASPYMQSMASTLEMNPADIDLFDPTIRKALSARGADGKPASKTLYEFEQDLRNDKRWLKTKNAQDQTMAAAHQVLADWGLTS